MTSELGVEIRSHDAIQTTPGPEMLSDETLPDPPEPAWRRYEQQIYEHLKRKATGAKVSFDKDGRQRLPGHWSKVERQIDVIVRGTFPGFPDELALIVDCKCFSKKVDVGDVDRFLGLVLDVRQPLGLMITNVGYSKAALQRAKENPGVSLDVVELDHLAGWEARLPTIAYTAGTNTATATTTTSDGATYTQVIDLGIARRILERHGRDASWIPEPDG